MAGYGIQFQPLPRALGREGGPIMRPEACPLPTNPPGGDLSAGVAAWPLPEIHMGEEGPSTELEV